MISLPLLRGRFGNHLFQYAFVRSTASRLGVRFYFPPWEGDVVFDLGDSGERATDPEPTRFRYEDFDVDYQNGHARNGGYKADAKDIADHTEIHGFFQSERYWERSTVQSWYRFREDKVGSVRERYRHLDFAESVGVHVRLGDFRTAEFADRFYVPRLRYYRRALALVPRHRHIIVFSDEPDGAKKHLRGLAGDISYVEGPAPYEQFYLQTLCRDFICSPSTFCWWAAWLNAHRDKVVVAPREGPHRPGSPDVNPDFWPVGWLRVRALWPVLDHYRTVKARIALRRRMERLK